LARGHDPRPVEANRDIKSIGHEETYPYDQGGRDALHREVVRMADAVAARLRASGLAGRTVTLKVRYGDFETFTRSQTLATATDNGPAIARIGGSLLDQVDVSPGVRLLGVSVSNLTRGRARQLTLDLVAAEAPDGPDQPDSASWEDAVGAVDRVRGRFGDRAVGPAVLLDGAGLRVKRPGDSQWGPNRPEPGPSRGAEAE
jgi:DNA polymerase-4